MLLYIYTVTIYRLVGSYEILTGGRTGDGLVDFTGGVNEFIEVHENTKTEELTQELFQV